MADSQINNSEYGQSGFLDFDKLLSEIQNEKDVSNIKEEMLVFQNGTTLDASGLGYNNVESSSIFNLHVDTNLKSSVTSGYQKDAAVKQEKMSPGGDKKMLDIKHRSTVLTSKHDMSCDIITPNLKNKPGFVKRVFNGEENRNGLIHNKVNHVFGKRTVYIKEESDSNNGFINDKTEAANGSNNIAFVKEEVKEESEDITEKDKSSPCDNTREIYDIDEQDDSFNDEMSVSEEEVNSSDIEEMFNNSKKRKKDKKENDQPLECPTCGKSFKLEHNLQKHALLHLNGDAEPVRKFECDICGKKFKKKHHLQRHNLAHTEKKEFACAHCEKSYKDKYDLKKHLAANHIVKECSSCGMKFENNSELKKHQVIHKTPELNSPRSVSCHICQKPFLKERYLKRHLKVHAKITPFPCKICNKSFLFPFLLHEHSRTHTGEKPFQCDKCDGKFSTKSNLVRHSRTHLKMKTCRNCYNEFEDEEQFKAHKESCTLKYECGKCGWICERLSNLRRHVKTHTKYSNPDGDDSINSSDESENIFVRIV